MRYRTPVVFSVAAMAASSACALATPPVSLAGDWSYAADPADAGVAEGWSTRRFEKTLKLPGSSDEAGLGALQPDTGKTLGHLVRRHDYLGAVWYARDIEVAPGDAGKSQHLTLERVMWASRVWVDGREVAGTDTDSLCVPHRYDLGMLTSGKHRLVVRVDNRMIHPIGNKNHGYGEQTQSRWNGIIGDITLEAREAARVERVRVFTPKASTGAAEVEFACAEARPGDRVRVTVTRVRDGATVATAEVAATSGRVSVDTTGKVTAWSEFTPELYDATVSVVRDGRATDTVSRRFGFRTVEHRGTELLVNGAPVFLRGNLDCVHFPKTGYPATTKAEWAAIFQKYKAHHLNHVRFHSWCPPKAAFEAADEMGLYIQAEGPIWIDGWMGAPNKRLEMDTEGYPKGLGRGDRSIDSFAQAEFRRIVDTYGDHPSFVLMAFGNELGPADFKETAKWVETLNAYDPRRLYAASTARAITPHCGFNATHNIPNVGWTRQKLEPRTDWDYETIYSKAPVPIIAHEVGQWPVYPDWSECEKFTGTLRNTRLEALREDAKRNGVFSDAADFRKASGALNQRLYKDEVESFLRTPSCRGFQLLSMQDFQGQGEAYVGWLDCFWDDKGTTAPAVFRGYCAPVVALARLPGYVFTDGDTLEADIVVRNDGAAPLHEAPVSVVLRDAAGKALATENLTVSTARGAVATAGRIRFPIAAANACRMDLVVTVAGNADANIYPIWGYPKGPFALKSDSVVIADRFDAATQAALDSGKSVLLCADKLGDDAARKRAAWKPLYWSVPFFPGQNIETIGLVVRDKHPAFSVFPTEAFGDWQWYEICQGARGFDLTGLVPESYKPAAQPVTDFHYNRKLASIFECRVGAGKLLVCGYPLAKDRPAVRQLARSLVAYAESPAFAPTQVLDARMLSELLRAPVKAAEPATGEFSRAAFRIIPGAAPTVAKTGYTLETPTVEGVWKDAVVAAWHGKRMKFALKLPSGVQGTLWVKFSDHNHNGRTGSLVVEGRATPLGKHAATPTHWVKVETLREDALDGVLGFETECATGPNLMVAEIAFVPKE